MKITVEERHHAEAEPAAGGGAGTVGGVIAAGFLDESRKAGFALIDLFGGGAFLRAEDGGGAVGAEQRIADIAGDDEQDAGRLQGQQGFDSAKIDQIAAGEAPAAFAVGGAAAEGEGGAPCLGAADAAVAGAAAAGAEDDAASAELGGFAQQFAGAVGGGARGIALSGGG